MSESSRARIDFANKVKNGEYTFTQAEAELDRMGECYGENAFLAGNVTRKDPPWTMEDLDDLYMEAIAGAGSREFFNYMAEVSDVVYSKKHRTKRLAILGGIASIIALIGIMIAVVHYIRT